MRLLFIFAIALSPSHNRHGMFKDNPFISSYFLLFSPYFLIIIGYDFQKQWIYRFQM